MKTLMMYKEKIAKWIGNNRKEFYFIAAIILLSAFLRLWGIREDMVFLGDQGRDALVAKEIIIDFNLAFLGPTASVGGFYLGPIYYYMIAPFMLMFGMDPVGAAVLVAFLGTLTVGLLYAVLRKAFGIYPAALATILYAVSPSVVEFSRTSWNPNPMPFFILASLSSFYYAVKKKDYKWYYLTGIFLGIVIQLHYLGLIFIGTVGLLSLLFTKRDRWKNSLIFEFLGFLTSTSLFLAFEFRHDFFNTKSVFEFITRSGGAARPESFNLPWLFFDVNRFSIESVLGVWASVPSTYLTYLLLGVFLFTVIYQFRKGKKFSLEEKILLLYWFITAIVLSMYSGQKYYHYFQILFPAPYILISYVISKIKNKNFEYLIGAVTLVASVFLLIKAPTWVQGSNLVDQTERVADQVITFSENDSYNFALISDSNTSHAYEYFLEIKGSPPTRLENIVLPQLIVVCERYPAELCAPLGNSTWEIAGFGRAELVDQIEVHPHITIFKLVHHADSIDKIGKPAK